MSESDLLAIGRGATEHLVAWFAQMLTITFAMIVAIYYFLKNARMSLKLFTFFAYTLGMIVLFGVMITESNIKAGATEGLERMTQERLAGPTTYYLALSHSWIAKLVSATFTAAVWVLWLGVMYLLFFAQKHWKSVSLTNRGDA